jgi:DNA invertase Pin-like site-specific DNA recombinase
MLAVLGGLADVELERDLIRTRTAEGRSRAQKRGQRMGRKPKLTEAQQAEARQRRAEGATLAELARSYGVGKSTISRLSSQSRFSLAAFRRLLQRQVIADHAAEMNRRECS